MLSNVTIDAIHDLPIEQIISQYITLKKAGVAFKACCPFHGEKSPSFVVSNQKNIFKCFGCGVGGDGIEFVMKHENLGFIEACKVIANQHGVIIEETEVKGKTEEQKNDEEVMMQLMRRASEVYRDNIQAPILEYLSNNRKLSSDSIIEWQLGLCHDWKLLAPELINAGTYKLAETCGLLKTGNGNTYDFFHHRITIPIHNAHGQVIGFGGRILPGVEGSKYVNPIENPLYPKSKILFGLHKARKQFQRHGGAVLVEGYFDVIKLHQHGWDNTIATCGTALTEDQAKLLKRNTDTVYLMRDGDKAGRKALEKDITVLVPQQMKIFVIPMPDGEDPDSLFDQSPNTIMNCLFGYQDGIEWLCKSYLLGGIESKDASVMAEAIDKTVKLLIEINNMVRREQYMKNLVAMLPKGSVKIADLAKPIDKLFQQREADKRALAEDDDDEYSKIPAWADRKQLEEHGFVQLIEGTKGYKPGIYFIDGSLTSVTNFTIKPLYHIFEQSNNRRLIEVNNCVRSAVVEMPTAGFVNQNTFETELMNKGNFITRDNFTKKHFKRIVGWLSNAMPIAYELKTLGWQPEGFFAYSNAVYVPGTDNIVEYDEMGMIRIEDKYYMSLGNSKVNRDERTSDNPYENDLYLKHVIPPGGKTVSFQHWAKLFFDTYSDNAPFGIAFAFITIFKDVITRIAKMPLLYSYGPKGSGKSAMAESIMWLFFSGKNGEGDLIKGYNLNPGQGTPFSFFNRVERFRNCPILFNEFDENNIEDWKFGTFKAAYDGEGREVGDGDSFKKRKTKIQKVQGTVMIVGQYMSIKDDGSVLSRSISCQFSLERVKNLSEEQNHSFRQLKDLEHNGLSSILIELLKQRGNVQKYLPKAFTDILTRLVTETREEGHRVEARLTENYSLILSATKVMSDIGIMLPYSFEEFYQKCKTQVISQNKLLKDNSAIHQFWKSVEFLFDTNMIVENRDLKVLRNEVNLNIKTGSIIEEKRFLIPKDIVLLRFSNVYSVYAKRIRETTGKVALPEDTLLLYMREQSYFIGLVPNAYFSDKRTSAYAFDYDKMKEFGIILERDNHREPEATPPTPQQPVATQLTIPPAGGDDDEPDFITNTYGFEKP